MPVDRKELEKILTEFYKLIEEKMRTGVPASTPVSNQPSSSQKQQQQQSQQPTTSPSESKDPKEVGWNNFFSKNKITDQNQQIAWKDTSGLDHDEAQQVWDNGWKDLLKDITNLGNKQVSYTSDEQTTDEVDLLSYEKGSLKAIHRLIFDVKNAGLSSVLPKDENIEKITKGKNLPDSKNYEALVSVRDDRAKELFKKAFESNNKNHGLSDEKIDEWRTNKTGLGGNGTNERKAFDNGWTNPEEIKNAKLASYTTPDTTQTETNIDVSKVSQPELDKANKIIEEIKATNTFKQIDEWKTNNEKRVDDGLDNNKLPAGKQQKEIWNIFTNHRNTFKYYLNVKDNAIADDGLTDEILTQAREKLKEENRWKSKEYKPLTAAILNELLADYLDKNAEKEDLDTWLRKLGGYTIDTEGTRKIKVAEVKEINGREEFTGKRVEPEIDGKKVIEQEEKWSKDKRLDLTGTYLLPFVYSLINFDPDVTGDVYAKLDKNGEIDKSGNGVLPILTGGGKTTKTVGCLVRGKKNNVVLICPNEALAADAENHHKTWLQKNKDGSDYKCVIHGESHGGYNVVKDDLIYYEDKSEATYDEKTKTWKGVKEGGEYGLSILQAEKLLGYIARSAVKPEKLQEPTGKKLEELKKTGQVNEKYLENIAEMKKKVISKEKTIIVFDEAHFNDPKYQELQKRLVKMNYKVIIMSATFPKKKFSVTMSHTRNVWLVPKFEPEYLKDEQGNILTMKDEDGNEVQVEKWMKQKTQIFLRTTEDEFEVNPATGKKGKQLLESGLTAKQKKLLDDNNIAYVCFDRTNQGAVTGITEGMPAGSLFFANPDHEMGFSPYVHNVICAGQSQLVSLGKSGTPWIYDTPEKIPLFLASMVQQIGRVARLFPGDAYLLTKNLHDVEYDVDADEWKLKILKPPKDLSYKFVTAALSGAKPDLDLLKNQGANMGDDPNFLRAALALPYKFGLKPEEILVGTGGTKPVYPVYGVKPTPPVVDEELWNRHLGNPTPPKIDKERSEQIMLLIIMTFLKNQSDITKEIDISFDNPLIKNIWGKEVPKEGSKKGGTKVVLGEDEKNKAVEEFRKVLHTVIDKHRKELKGYEESKNEYLATEEDTFNMLVKLYRVVNETEITVEPVTDGGKEKINVRIAYPKVGEEIGKRSIDTLEEIDVWRCHRCLKINNGYRFCEQCGIDVRIDKKEEEKIKLIEELQASIEVKK